MASSVFGKIIRGEIPCHKVYEDERVLAFLDIGPLSEGHALVIPKEPAVTLDELSDGVGCGRRAGLAADLPGDQASDRHPSVQRARKQSASCASGRSPRALSRHPEARREDGPRYPLEFRASRPGASRGARAAHPRRSLARPQRRFVTESYASNHAPELSDGKPLRPNNTFISFSVRPSPLVRATCI